MLFPLPYRDDVVKSAKSAARPLFGGGPDSAGNGIQSRRALARQRLRADAVDASHGPHGRAPDGDHSLKLTHAAESRSEHRARHPVPEGPAGQLERRLVRTLAAYNAGPAGVRQWLPGDNYREPVEFVESIPFNETREYVQAVLRNADIYRELYGKGNIPVLASPATTMSKIPPVKLATPVRLANVVKPAVSHPRPPHGKSRLVEEGGAREKGRAQKGGDGGSFHYPEARACLRWLR